MKTEAAFQSFEENNIAYHEVATGGSNHTSVINISNNNSVFLLEEQWFMAKRKLSNKPTEVVEALLFYVNEMLEKRNLLETCIVFKIDIFKRMFRGTQCSEERDSTFAKVKMLVLKSVAGIGCLACILNK